jgi:hypothetical protein
LWREAEVEIESDDGVMTGNAIIFSVTALHRRGTDSTQAQKMIASSAIKFKIMCLTVVPRGIETIQVLYSLEDIH